VRRAALIALLALAASACTIDLNVGISLNENGSGSLVVDIVTDDEFEELYRLTGREFEDLVAARGTEVGLAFTVTPGTNTVYAARANNMAAETLTGILEGIAPGSSNVVIARSATKLEFDAQLNPLTDDVAPYFEDSNPEQFAEDVSITVTLSMAGEIDSSTATSTDGNRLSWTVPFSDSGTRLFARSIFEKEGSSVPWTVVIVGGIMVVAVVFLIAIRSNLPAPEEDARPGVQPQPMRQVARPPVAESSPPEDQGVAPDSTPPEDQPVAPPEENS
jgi:hypothetical protein